MALTKVTYSMIDGAMVNVLDYGAVGDNSTDCTAAIQAAIDTGRPVFLPEGVYKITAPLISHSSGMVLIGETFAAMSEKNNEENNFYGSVINYFGSDTAYPIDINNSETTNQICLKNLTVVAAKTHQFGVVRIKGDVYSAEYGAQVTMSDVRIQTRGFDVSGGALNGYVCTGLVLDCDARWFFGSSFTNLYFFGLQTGIFVTADNDGFFNSNTFTNIKLYQVWRALHLKTSGFSSATSIVANLFDGFYVQPNSQSGVWCDGVIFLENNVAQNVFVAPNVYDMPLGTGVEFRSETDFIGSGRWFENVFIGPMCNNIFNGRIGSGYFVGWGVNSFGQTAASSLSLYAADPTINTTATLVTLIDQNNATIRYPRNGAANDIEVYVSGTIRAATLNFQGVFMPVQAVTASAPTYVKGGMYFDTTLNKLRIGGATGWETVTST